MPGLSLSRHCFDGTLYYDFLLINYVIPAACLTQFRKKNIGDIDRWADNAYYLYIVGRDYRQYKSKAFYAQGTREMGS